MDHIANQLLYIASDLQRVAYGDTLPTHQKYLDNAADNVVSEYKGRFRQEWHKLLEDEIEGRRAELFGYGHSKEEVESDIAQWRVLGTQLAKRLLKEPISSFQDAYEIMYAPEYQHIWGLYEDFWYYLDRDMQGAVDDTHDEFTRY